MYLTNGFSGVYHLGLILSIEEYLIVYTHYHFLYINKTDRPNSIEKVPRDLHFIWVKYFLGFSFYHVINYRAREVDLDIYKHLLTLWLYEFWTIFRWKLLIVYTGMIFILLANISNSSPTKITWHWKSGLVCSIF